MYVKMGGRFGLSMSHVHTISSLACNSFVEVIDSYMQVNAIVEHLVTTNSY